MTAPRNLGMWSQPLSLTIGPSPCTKGGHNIPDWLGSNWSTEFSKDGICATAAHVIMFLLVGMFKTMGIFFVEIQKKFSASSSMASLLTSVSSGMFSIISLPLMTLGMQAMTCRTAVAIGSITLCVAYVISAFANDMNVLILSHGVLYGSGAALIISPSLVMVSSHFNKYRGLASAITEGGSSLGGLVFPLLLTYLFEVYGFTGTFLITAGLLLNCLAAGALFRPFTSYPKGSTSEKTHSDTLNPLIQYHENGMHLNSKPYLEKVIRTAEEYEISLDESSERCTMEKDFEDAYGHNKAKADTFRLRSISLLDKTKSRFAANYEDRKYSSATNIYEFTPLQLSSSGIIAISVPDINHDRHDFVKQAIKQKDKTVKESGLSSKTTMKNICRRAFDCSLWKNPVFVTLLPAAALFNTGLAVLPVYLAPHAREVGLDERAIGLIFTVIGSVDLPARLFFGWFSDKKYISRPMLVVIATTLLSIATHFVHFYTDFVSLVIFSVIWGMLHGVFFTLFAPILVDLLGLEKLEPALGFCILFEGIVAALGFIVIGAIRDATGSYQGPFHLVGGMLFVGAILMLITSRLHRRNNS